jgi:hypothetical protein
MKKEKTEPRQKMEETTVTVIDSHLEEPVFIKDPEKDGLTELCKDKNVLTISFDSIEKIPSVLGNVFCLSDEKSENCTIYNSRITAIERSNIPSYEAVDSGIEYLFRELRTRGIDIQLIFVKSKIPKGISIDRHSLMKISTIINKYSRMYEIGSDYSMLIQLDEEADDNFFTMSTNVGNKKKDKKKKKGKKK